MIYDILEVFKKLYEEKGDKLILDSYSLKDGLYVKVDKDDSLEYFIVKRKNKELIFTDINNIQNSKMYDWFKQRDYYSTYLNSNKAFHDKKIHNINYLSLFIKIESFISKDEKKLLSQNAIKEQYTYLYNYKKFKKPKEKETLKEYQMIFKDRKRKKDIIKKYKTIRKNLNKIVEVAKENNVVNYIKIFFDEDIEVYKKESNIYYSLKIFNDISHNEKIQNSFKEETFGLSDQNMGLNSKKPYLEHKTRKVVAPFMLENEDALMLKKFFDWLKLQPYRDNDNKTKDRYLDEEHFFMQKHSKNDESEIIDFNYIPLSSANVQKHFKSISVKNYLKVRKGQELIQDYDIESLTHLEQRVNELFYNNQLIFNYYKDAKDIKVSGFLSKQLQSILFITKFSMNNYFRKYDESNFLSIIKKHSTSCVLDSFLHSRELKAKEALNLKFAILENKGEKVVNIETMLDSVENKLEKVKDNKALNKEEFLFLSGQWAYYLLSQSKASDRTFSLAEHYFRIKSIDKLKFALKNDLNKYKHAISRDSKKIRKVISLVTSFESDNSRLSDYELDIFLVGFTVENLFYKKNKKEVK